MSVSFLAAVEPKLRQAAAFFGSTALRALGLARAQISADNPAARMQLLLHCVLAGMIEQP